MDNKKVEIKYLLNEEGRKDSILKNQGGERVQKIETEITDRILKLARVDENGNIYLNIGFRYSYNNKIEKIVVDYEELEGYLGAYSRPVEKIIEFDKVMTVDELIDWEEKSVEFIGNRFNSHQKICKERNEKIKKKDKEDEECRIRKRQEILDKDNALKEKENRKRELFKKEREHWIQENGSQYLKDAIRLGYNVNSKYVTERARNEFPKYTVDINENADYHKKRNPSKGALEEVVKLVNDGHDAGIIWLSSFGEEDYNDNDYYENTFEECEAIIIKDYLGYFELIKML